MDASKHFYGESLFERNKRTYGYHPKCKKCLTRREEKCKDPQYAAMGVADLYCADYKEEKMSDLMKTIKEGEIRRIVFPKIKPNKCGDIRGGFVDYRPENAKCENEAKYYMGRKMQENGMFRNLQCLCEDCMKSNVVDKEE